MSLLHFSLPHDIFLTKSIIYMGFKFNLNVMNLNWALLYFKVVGLLFCKLTFSTRDSASGFWFQLLSLTLKFLPAFPPPPLSSFHSKSICTAFNWLVAQEGYMGMEKGATQPQLRVLGVWGLLAGASNRKALRENQIDIFLRGIMRFSLHMSAYLSNHSLPQSESS